MSTDESKSRPRDHLRHRCPSCEARVDAADANCSGCGAPKPAKGWVRVTELVVHAGFDVSEEDVPTVRGRPPVIMPPSPATRGPRSAPAPIPTPPVHRTVYLEAPSTAAPPGDPDGRHTLGLAATFLVTFTGTTVAVLAAWATLSHRPLTNPLQRDPPPPIEAAAAPEVAPTPPQPAEIPGAILDGSYVGVISDAGGDRPVTFTFRFLGDGVLQAEIELDQTTAVQTTGIYGFSDGSANFEVIDDGGGVSRVYTGSVAREEVSGEVTTSSGEVSPFSAQR